MRYLGLPVVSRTGLAERLKACVQRYDVHVDSSAWAIAMVSAVLSLLLLLSRGLPAAKTACARVRAETAERGKGARMIFSSSALAQLAQLIPSVSCEEPLNFTVCVNC